MRIPDGDLMPARRHRYGSGYGRRRRRRQRGLAVLAVLVLAGAGVGLWLTRTGSPAVVVAKCPAPSAPPAVVLPPAREVRLTLLNGTSRNGLAESVAAQLRAEGFVVAGKGNAAAALPGASQVTYGDGAQLGAHVLAAHVLGAVVLRDPRAAAGSLTLVLGGAFQRLATPAETAAGLRALAAQVAVPAPTATPSRGCRS